MCDHGAVTLPRLARAGAVLAAAVLLAGCSAQAASTPSSSVAVDSAPASVPAEASATPPPDEPAGTSPSVTTREMSPDGVLTDFYLPGVTATLRVPATKGPAPLVVVVPGGGWQTADPTDYVPLAQSLTSSGVSTSVITYDTGSTGAQFPKPIDDVACAVRWSAYQLNALGYPPTRVVVVGHSAGGQIAVEVAVTGDQYGGDCPMPPVTVDGVVGVAGVYDLSSDLIAAANLFPDGGTADERAHYSPLNLVNDPQTSIPPLDVLLLAGTDDVTVPAAQAEQMAAAFKARGVDATIDVLPLPHNMGFPLALEISPIIKRWLLGDAYVESPSPSPTPPPAASPVPSAAPAPPASAAPPVSPAASAAAG